MAAAVERNSVIGACTTSDNLNFTVRTCEKDGGYQRGFTCVTAEMITGCRRRQSAYSLKELKIGTGIVLGWGLDVLTSTSLQPLLVDTRRDPGEYRRSCIVSDGVQKRNEKPQKDERVASKSERKIVMDRENHESKKSRSKMSGEV